MIPNTACLSMTPGTFLQKMCNRMNMKFCIPVRLIRSYSIIIGPDFVHFIMRITIYHEDTESIEFQGVLSPCFSVFSVSLWFIYHLKIMNSISPKTFLPADAASSTHLWLLPPSPCPYEEKLFLQDYISGRKVYEMKKENHMEYRDNYQHPGKFREELY